MTSPEYVPGKMPGKFEKGKPTGENVKKPIDCRRDPYGRDYEPFVDPATKLDPTAGTRGPGDGPVR